MFVCVCVRACVRACVRVCVIFLFSFSVCYLFICISLQFGGIKVEINAKFTIVNSCNPTQIQFFYTIALVLMTAVSLVTYAS